MKFLVEGFKADGELHRQYIYGNSVGHAYMKAIYQKGFLMKEDVLIIPEGSESST